MEQLIQDVSCSIFIFTVRRFSFSARPVTDDPGKLVF